MAYEMNAGRGWIMLLGGSRLGQYLERLEKEEPGLVLAVYNLKKRALIQVDWQRFRAMSWKARTQR
jgi:hypothetical protein